MCLCLWWAVSKPTEWSKAGSEQSLESRPPFWTHTPETTCLALCFPYIHHKDVQLNFSCSMKPLRWPRSSQTDTSVLLQEAHVCWRDVCVLYDFNAFLRRSDCMHACSMAFSISSSSGEDLRIICLWEIYWSCQVKCVCVYMCVLMFGIYWGQEVLTNRVRTF